MFLGHPAVFIVLALPSAILGAIISGLSTGSFSAELIPVFLLVVAVGLVSGMASVMAADDLQAGRAVRLGTVVPRAIGKVAPVVLSALAQYLAIVGLAIIAAIILSVFVVAKLVPLVVLTLVVMIGVLVYFLLRWSLAFTAIALEQKGPIEALGRSRQLTRGNVLRIFGVFLAVGVLTLPLPFAIGLLSVGSSPSIVIVLLEIAAGLVSGPLFAIASMTILSDVAGRADGAPTTARAARNRTLLAAALIVVGIAAVAVTIPNLGAALDRASLANVPVADRGVILTGTSRATDLCHPLNPQATFSTSDSIFIGGYFTRAVPAGATATIDFFANGTLANSGQVGDPTRPTNCYVELKPIVNGSPGTYRLVVSYGGEVIAQGTFTVR